MCCVGAQLFHYLPLFPSISPPALKLFLNVQPDVCRGGGHGSFLSLLLFVLLLPHVSCRSMALEFCV